jgi:methylated-DNA-[protein]-cysteine S-methyltransferase
MRYSTTYPSPLGEITLASDGKNLAGLWLAGQKYHGAALYNDMAEKAALPVFGLVTEWLNSYFKGENPGISDLPLAPAGSAFRHMIWRILCEIPYGEVTSYGEIARKAAAITGKNAMSSRAVGGAVGRNPISIIIPCHRVVGANGSLTGYGGGIERKAQLLKLEGVDMTRLYIPTKGTAL